MTRGCLSKRLRVRAKIFPYGVRLAAEGCIQGGRAAPLRAQPRPRNRHCKYLPGETKFRQTARGRKHSMLQHNPPTPSRACVSATVGVGFPNCLFYIQQEKKGEAGTRSRGKSTPAREHSLQRHAS